MPRHTTITEQAAKKFIVKSGRVDHFDSSYPGLALRVSDSGRKVWVYFFRLTNGKVHLHRMTLGVYPAMGVADAHEAWRKAFDFVQAGRDPRGDQDTDKPATDFEGVLAEWLLRDQGKFKSSKQTARRMAVYVTPSWKQRDITEITRRNCLDLIDAISDRGTVVLARRVHAHLHRFFTWAVGRGIVKENPLLNAEKPGSEESRDRVLNDDELVKVWKATDKIGGAFRDAIRLLILTGARREEIGQLRWSEIKDGAIHLAGARTKNGKPHIIPLSVPAQAIVAGIERKGDFVFGGALVNWSRRKIRLDDISAVAGWRIHDLRRTVATGLQKLGIQLQVTESVLGHVSGSRSGIVGVYQRHDYADEKAEALNAWGARVIAMVDGKPTAEVVPLRRA